VAQNIDSISYASLMFNFFDCYPTLTLNFKSSQAFDMTQEFKFDGHSYISKNFRHARLNDAHSYFSEWVPAAAGKPVTAGVNSVQGLANSLTDRKVNGSSVSLQNFGSMLGGNILLRNRVSYLEQGIFQFLYIDDSAVTSYTYESLPVKPLTLTSENLINSFLITSDVNQTFRNTIQDSLNERKILYRQHMQTYFDLFLTVQSMNEISPIMQYDFTFNDDFYNKYSSAQIKTQYGLKNAHWQVVYLEKYIKGNTVQYRVKFGIRVRK
jgi:hypothetical protein